MGLAEPKMLDVDDGESAWEAVDGVAGTERGARLSLLRSRDAAGAAGPEGQLVV